MCICTVLLPTTCPVLFILYCSPFHGMEVIYWQGITDFFHPNAFGEADTAFC